MVTGLRGSWLVAIVCTAATPSSALTAQEGHPVPAGATVRVWARDYGLNKTRATVLGWSDTTGSFTKVAASGDSVVVPFRGITRIDQLQGKNTVLGFFRGAAIGGAFGMLVGGAAGESKVQGCSEFLCELEALDYMAAGLAIGAVGGGILGGAIPPDRWGRVSLPTSAGFPGNEKPFHDALAFQLLSAGSLLLVTALLAGT